MEHIKDDQGNIIIKPRNNSAIGKRWIRMFEAAKAAAKASAEAKLAALGLTPEEIAALR